jgi:hypothetical protein
MLEYPLEVVQQRAAENRRIYEEWARFRALLVEWQATPFFENRAAWRGWQEDFGTRVSQALAAGHEFAPNRPGREMANAGDDEFCRLCDQHEDAHR